ncbi:MAG: FAD binding domain-containing protein [candidate division KSB1 bacterium]|nr:FAD binding domain-containing protein [candidate division KSB1 bacterium]MDQ7063670.1 FAD binding domain-containing protein [candidate division KSB1 bacterium]
MPPTIQFILNDRTISTDIPTGLLVLDFLRKYLHLHGTKEGCKEGDCGACTVLVGELRGRKVEYLPVTSCLMPVGELHGKHLVTIEGLNLPQLNPAQEAIVEEGATQCGFCTPGIVVSMTGYLMQADGPVTADGIKMALSGHLCRCTGYRSLKQSWMYLQQRPGQRRGIEALVKAGILPEYFLEIPKRLRAIPPLPEKAPSPQVVIAGGTDLYVQQGERLPDIPVGVLNLRPELRGIQRENGHLRVGALTTFEEFAAHAEVRRLVPDIDQYMALIASWQIRNRATLGGNIVNASPIADMTILLLALNATLVLQNGSAQREVPLAEFYRGYKTLDKQPDELVYDILIPLPPPGTKINWEKVSKRKYLDIASVNSAIAVRVEDGHIAEATLAMGGVAPVPLLMRRTGAFLIGKPLAPDTVTGAIEVAQQEISPISDIRGSADYKRLLTRQLTIAHFCKLFPEQIKARDVYESQ